MIQGFKVMSYIIYNEKKNRLRQEEQMREEEYILSHKKSNIAPFPNEYQEK